MKCEGEATDAGQLIRGFIAGANGTGRARSGVSRLLEHVVVCEEKFLHVTKSTAVRQPVSNVKHEKMKKLGPEPIIVGDPRGEIHSVRIAQHSRMGYICSGACFGWRRAGDSQKL